ncbi:3339_t:CDS:2 [Funneliformis caledonium]|uniref:3339_t:CDS:1 n=1 Tax=Funneliformis caledonium TaxID=1117310 RepID=A0A9N8ZEI9_9GLOM|nr:3339_t:CDS:2 [Funneliformis caledonium]
MTKIDDHIQSFDNHQRDKRIKKYLNLFLALVISSSLYIAYIIRYTNASNKITQYSSGISYETYHYGLLKCEEIKRIKPDNNQIQDRRRNPRFVPGTKDILFKNARILDGIGHDFLGDILLKNGIISEITNIDENDIKKNDINVTDDTVMIDLKKKFVTPGLIDMHSHAGLLSWPFLRATNDINEETDPLTPFVRVKDALNPSDPAIRIISSGGVTTSLIIPGSGNLMGGEGHVIKMRNVSTLSVVDMGINYGIDPSEEKEWRWLKMACGENPKKVYALQDRIPTTRLGEGWLFRKKFQEARDHFKRQNDWCDSASKLSSNNNVQLDSPFPEDLQYDSLMALFRGDARLNIHCYETNDLEAIINHSLEFNFTITALHHALDAYRIPDIIKRANSQITIATFSDNWGYKKEAFQASTRSPKILADAGIPVALKSDHPVINAQHLAFEAAKAHHYGLDEKLSIASITSVPAKALGLNHRIGQISIGYDADLVVWDSHPLSLGATPLEVYIDGIPQFGTPNSVLSGKSKCSKGSSAQNEPVKEKGNERTASSVVINNIGKIFVDKDTILEPNNNSSVKDENISMIIKDGLVECIGNCAISNHNSSEMIDLNGGYVLPGIVAIGASLGLIEIDLEPSTTDGFVPIINHPDSVDQVMKAIDGLKFGGKHLDVAYKAGVLSSITSPLSFGLIKGISVAFKTGSHTVLDEESIIESETALHVQIGTLFKNAYIPSVSSQIGLLRRTLLKAVFKPTKRNIYSKVANGLVPLAAHTDSKDEIASLIRLKQLVKRHGGDLRLVIIGGAEAHLIADQISKNNVSVVLSPSRPVPSLWTAKNVLTGSPITNTTGIEILVKHKVKVAIGVDNSAWTRNLVWDAGWAVTNSKGLLDEKDAVALISWNLEEIFNLNRKKLNNQGLNKGNIANFVAYDGNPFDLHTKVKLVAGGGRKDILIDPIQD